MEHRLFQGVMMLGVIGTISVGDGPIDVAVSPDGTRIYVANQGDGTVSVIVTATNSVTATIAFAIESPYPNSVVVHPDGSRAYVSHRGVVAVIHTATNTVSSYISVGSSSLDSELAIHPDGSKLFVALATYPEGTVAVIDTATDTVAATITVDDPAYRPAVSPDGSRMYVPTIQSVVSGPLAVIDTATNTFVGSVNFGGGSTHVVLSPDGTRIYATDYATTPGTVKVIDTASGVVTGTIPVGIWQLAGIAIDPDGSLLYVVDRAGPVSVIDTSTDTVTTTIEVGVGDSSAWAVAIKPDGSSIYVTNPGANTVSVISQTFRVDPSVLPKLVGKLFGGVDVGGGGWLVIGNHFYKIPPRAPDMAIIARAAAPLVEKPIENRTLGEQLRKGLH